MNMFLCSILLLNEFEIYVLKSVVSFFAYAIYYELFTILGKVTCLLIFDFRPAEPYNMRVIYYYYY